MRSILEWIKFPYLWLRYGSPVKSDETVILFPQSASLETDQQRSELNRWVVPVHAWVIEKETGTLSRLLGKHSVLSFLDLTGVVSRQSATPIFENRLSWFMADREINKKIKISLAEQTFVSPRTKPNGHVKFQISYSGSAPDGSVLRYQLVDLPDGMHPIEGRVQLVAERGLSVISDIDDTIKISKVTSKRDLVRGLFFDEYHVAPGMPEFYQNLANAGASFHYVSASPWQLYPSLAPFLDKFFPFGCLSQRHFYIGDKSFVKFFRSSLEYKVKTVSRLLERYPHRQFILIGDSGERDPEVYLQIAKKYPHQVGVILIREVYTGDDLQNSGHQERWQRIRDELMEHQQLQVFHRPIEIDESELFDKLSTAATVAEMPVSIDSGETV